MNFATKSVRVRILVWLIWAIALWVFTHPVATRHTFTTGPLLGVVSHDPQNGPLFPWQPRYRWKKRALEKYKAWQRAYRRAKWVAWWARLALSGAITFAQVVDWLTYQQRHYQIGALPVLYALLETLQVRHIINRHCPGRSEVDHGAVALVLILNRLLFPLPLYRVADWVAGTVLVTVLGIPAQKFNDDRLGRTLDALTPHLEAIWLEVVEQAIGKANVDLSVIFYDLTAFITHGQYANSDHIRFGFAHNTPMDKRKFKTSLNVAADGNIPWLYRFLSGDTADTATVERNMRNLAYWLQRRGYQLADTLVVGDRAMLNDGIAVAYEQRSLRYLAGLRCARKAHKQLLYVWTDEQFAAYPLEAGPQPQYWGRGCTVSFTHEGQTVQHRGLVVLAGPIRDQLRQSRQKQLLELDQALCDLRAKVGQPHYRTSKSLQRKVNARCRQSPVGQLMVVTVYETAAGAVNLHWHLNKEALRQVERRDGRYLLVTNDDSLTHQQMFDLYRQKDGVEKRFRICKSDLKVSPVRLHQDQRIASLLLLNMIALLAYSLLERQVRQNGLQITTRQLIQRLERLTLIETHCHDGSCLRRTTPIEPEVVLLLQLVAKALSDLMAAAGLDQVNLTALPTAPQPLPLLTAERLC